jgi:hypothetical protein
MQKGNDRLVGCVSLELAKGPPGGGFAYYPWGLEGAERSKLISELFSPILARKF